jgi:hypothetical protein
LFELIAASDIVIFGPTGAEAYKMKGYMNLPIKERGTDYFLELGPRQCEQIVGILLNQSEGST